MLNYRSVSQKKMYGNLNHLQIKLLPTNQPQSPDTLKYFVKDLLCAKERKIQRKCRNVEKVSVKKTFGSDALAQFQ